MLAAFLKMSAFLLAVTVLDVQLSYHIGLLELSNARGLSFPCGLLFPTSDSLALFHHRFLIISDGVWRSHQTEVLMSSAPITSG
jgi:hypothetical protein